MHSRDGPVMSRFASDAAGPPGPGPGPGPGLTSPSPSPSPSGRKLLSCTHHGHASLFLDRD